MLGPQTTVDFGGPLTPEAGRRPGCLAGLCSSGSALGVAVEVWCSRGPVGGSWRLAAAPSR
jgi:hypothetical protein